VSVGPRLDSPTPPLPAPVIACQPAPLLSAEPLAPPEARAGEPLLSQVPPTRRNPTQAGSQPRAYPRVTRTQLFSPPPPLVLGGGGDDDVGRPVKLAAQDGQLGVPQPNGRVQVLPRGVVPMNPAHFGEALIEIDDDVAFLRVLPAVRRFPGARRPGD